MWTPEKAKVCVRKEMASEATELAVGSAADLVKKASDWARAVPVGISDKKAMKAEARSAVDEYIKSMIEVAELIEGARVDAFVAGMQAAIRNPATARTQLERHAGHLAAGTNAFPSRVPVSVETIPHAETSAAAAARSEREKKEMEEEEKTTEASRAAVKAAAARAAAEKAEKARREDEEAKNAVMASLAKAYESGDEDEA